MKVLRQLAIDGNTIEYQVVRSNRRKTSELFVDSKTVLIRTPSHKSPKDIEKIIKAKAYWIIKKQERYKQLTSKISNPTFEHGSLLPYLGKGYPLSIVTDSKFKEDKIRFTNGEFLLTLKTSRKDQKRGVAKLYHKWLQEKAQGILEQKVQKYATLVNATPTKVIIKDIRNRWGSATKTNVLGFNLRLLKAPEDVIDYIVLHEVCHLRVRDHSLNFWNLLQKTMPNYKEKAEWLSTSGVTLIE